MRSVLGLLGPLLLISAGCKDESPSEPKWLEYSLVSDPASGAAKTATPYSYFSAAHAATETVNVETPLRKCRLKLATPTRDPMGDPAVYIRVDDQDTLEFKAFTAASLDRELVTIVDGKVASKGVLRAELPGEFLIFGQLTEADQKRILQVLR